MARLPRPSISLATKLYVARSQLLAHGVLLGLDVSAGLQKTLALWLDLLRTELRADRLELHHRPALVNREKLIQLPSGRRVRAVVVPPGGQVLHYFPDANDPEYLAYEPEADHDIETRVRGKHGQHSDLALARKNRRIARKRAGKIKSRPIPRRQKPWPPRGRRSFRGGKRAKEPAQKLSE